MLVRYTRRRERAPSRSHRERLREPARRSLGNLLLGARCQPRPGYGPGGCRARRKGASKCPRFPSAVESARPNTSSARSPCARAVSARWTPSTTGMRCGRRHPGVDRGRGRRRSGGTRRFFRLRRPSKPRLAPGCTPLVTAPRLASALGVGELYLKLDTANPTHSFKDRVVAVAVREGAGARVSTRSRALRPATSRTPSQPGPPPRGWRRPSSARPISSPRSSSPRRSTARRSTPSAARTTTAAGSPSSSRSSCPGASSTSACAPTTPRARRRSAFEIAEQLGWELPDVVVAPIASGAMYSKVGQGFAELRPAGSRRWDAAADDRRAGRGVRARRGRARRGPAGDAGPARTRSRARSRSATRPTATSPWRPRRRTGGDIHITPEDEIGINMALLAETTGDLRRDGRRRDARRASRGGSPRPGRRGRPRRHARHGRRVSRRPIRSPSGSSRSRSTPTRTRCSTPSASRSDSWASARFSTRGGRRSVMAGGGAGVPPLAFQSPAGGRSRSGKSAQASSGPVSNQHSIALWRYLNRQAVRLVPVERLVPAAGILALGREVRDTAVRVAGIEGDVGRRALLHGEADLREDLARARDDDPVADPYSADRRRDRRPRSSGGEFRLGTPCPVEAVIPENPELGLACPSRDGVVYLPLGAGPG